MEFTNGDWVFVAKSSEVENNTSVGSSVWRHLPTGKYAIRGITGKHNDDILWINHIQTKRPALLHGGTTVLSVTSEKDGKEDTAYIDTAFAIKLIQMGVMNVKEPYKITVPSHRGTGKTIDATVEVDCSGNLLVARDDGTPITFCTNRNRVDLAVALLKVASINELIENETFRKIAKIACIAVDVANEVSSADKEIIE